VSALLVDVGNTRIKWARLEGSRLAQQRAAAFAGWDVADFARRLFGAGRRIDRVLVSNVAGARVARVLAQAAKRAGAPKPEFVASQRRTAGVTTTYLDPWRLGVDRFVMAIAAHRLAKGRPACIASVGTTLTLDLVDGKGRHLGGAILPAPGLIVDSVLRGTDGIRKRATGGRTGKRSLFSRTTRAAIEEGALHAAAAVVERAAEEADRLLGKRPLIILTGGALAEVAPLIRSPHATVPDLVLRGLAVLARMGATGASSR
jgi:type III pantothenate kinase